MDSLSNVVGCLPLPTRRYVESLTPAFWNGTSCEHRVSGRGFGYNGIGLPLGSA